MFTIAYDNTSRLVKDPWSQNPVQMPGTEDFVPVVSVDVGGYEWAELHAWYSPGQRRYFWSGQTGCSCYRYEVYSLGGLQVGSKDDLLRSIKEWVDEDAKYYGVDGIAVMQAARDFKEPRQ